MASESESMETDVGAGALPAFRAGITAYLHIGTVGLSAGPDLLLQVFALPPALSFFPTHIIFIIHPPHHHPVMLLVASASHTIIASHHARHGASPLSSHIRVQSARVRAGLDSCSTERAVPWFFYVR